MRHQRAGLHLSRTPAHRKALFSNLVAALLTFERIRTTDVKAKEVRRIAERTITWARRLGDILTKAPEKRSADEKARVVHAIRMCLRVVRDRDAVMRLFEEIGPRFLTRHGGYTRLMKVGQRPGDAAEMSLLELIPAEGAPAEEPKAKDAGPKAKAPKKEAGEKQPSRAKATRSEGRPAATKVKKAAPARSGAAAGAAARRSPRGNKGGGE